MSNTILTPSIIAKEALMILRNNAVMPKLVHRDFSNEFVGAVGDTITVRKPAKFVAKDFNGAIEVQDAKESGVPVVMNKHLDVSIAVSSKEMAMEIADFSKQILEPAMQAFIDEIDKDLIALESEATHRVPHSAGAFAPADMLAARKYLVENAAPLTDRHFVVGATAEADLLGNELFISAEKVGDAGTALREASLGKKYGMNVYCDQNIAKNGDYTPSIAFHRNAMALVTRPLALPLGAANSAIVNYDGFGLRVVYGYDQNTKKDTISIDMLYGVKLLDDALIAVVTDTRAE